MSLTDVASHKWAYLLDPDWIGQNGVSVTFNKRCVDFQHPPRPLCTMRPPASRVDALAHEILQAPEELRAGILLHFSYWPNMINDVILEMHRRGQKRKREFQREMQTLRRRLKREEEHSAPPASQTPAIIALPNGTWDAGMMEMPPTSPASPHPSDGDDTSEDVSVTLGSHDTDDFSEMYANMNGVDTNGSEDGGHSEHTE